MSETLQYILAALGSLAAAVLLYKGTQFTAARAKEGVERSADVNAQTSALNSISGYNEQLREDNAGLRERLDKVEQRLDDETTARRDQQRAHDRELEGERRAREEQVTRLTERIDLLTLQLTEWKRLARVLARWGTALRDQVLTLGGTVPATPEELLTLQAIEDTEQDPPLRPGAPPHTDRPYRRET
ncbi:MAG: hypothetical protein CMH83_19355 [Nocardioides sp.]|nr:hypothetical protein [Nocardioides sp.]